MILVTGATGFLGSEVCAQLTAQGEPVRALKRSGAKIPDLLAGNKHVSWFEAALDDTTALEAALNGVTKAYHCAAFISFNPADKQKLFKTNITGTANLVNLCLDKGIRLLHVSSVAALGDARKGELITETDYPEPGIKTHAYGISKYEGEMEVWRGIAEGLDAIIVNPSVIIGANTGFEGSGAIFKLVKDGLRFYTSGASGFVDVADVARCMTALMDMPVTGERFIISAENYHYKDLFEAIANGFGIKPPGINAKPWMLGLAWRGAKLAALLTGKAPALTRDSAKSSFNLSYYANEKIKHATGLNFKPVKDSIAEITARLKETTSKSFKTEGRNG